MDSGRVAGVLVASLVIAGLVAVPSPFCQNARAAPVIWSGDRTVSGNETYSGDAIILSANLTIRGSLTFCGVDLQVSSPSNTTFGIDVAEGGAFHVLAGSRIHSTDQNIHFAFRVRPNAMFVMNDSELNDCGWDDIVNFKKRPDCERGLYIEGTNASITNSTIRWNNIGILVDHYSSSYIYHNNISDNDNSGIDIAGSSSPTIDRCVILGNVRYALGFPEQAGISSFWGTPVITNNTIHANLDLRSNYSAGGIKLIGGGTPSVLDNEIFGHDEPSYLCALESSGSNVLLRGNRIHDNSNGVSLYSGVTIVEGNVLENNTAAGYDNEGFGFSVSSWSSFCNNTVSGSKIGILLGGFTSSFENETIVHNGRGVDERGGPFAVTMTNCTFAQNGWDVNLEGWGNINYYSTLALVNPTYDPKKVTATNENDYLSVWWSVRARALYENGLRPVEDAEVRFENALGGLAATCRTGPDGRTQTLLLEEYCVTIGHKQAKSPYNMSATGGWRSNWTGPVAVDQSGEFTIMIDDLPPLLRITEPANNSLTNQTSVMVRGAGEPGAGLVVDSVPLTVRPDGGWSVRVPLDAEGANEIVAEARDRTGNQAVEARTVFRDTIAPVLALTGPLDGFLTNQSSILVNGSCSDPAARTTVNGREVVLGQDGGFSAWVDLAEGPNTITAESRDGAGNIARSVLSGELDSLPPDLRVLEPRPGLLTNLSTVTVRGFAEEGSEVTVNGHRCQLPGMEFSFVLDLQEGPNAIDVAARDRAGNVNSSTILVISDTRAPPLFIESPRNGELRNTSRVELRGTTEAGALLTVNGVEDGPGGGPFCITLQLPEGTNVLTVEASDAAGNRARKVLTVTVDTLAPGLTVSSPSGRTLTNQPGIELRGRTEPGAFVSVNGLGVAVGKDGSFAAQVGLEREGQNTLLVRSRDAAWNTAEAAFAVTRDTILYYNITGPGNNEKVNSKSVVVSGDAEAGARITVGNLTVFPGADGRFSKGIQLQYGANNILITITDAAGNQATETLTVFRPGAASPAPAKGFIGGFTTAAAVAAAALAVVAVGVLRRKGY